MIRFVPNALTVGRLFLSVIFLWMVLHSPKAEHRTALLDGAFVMFLVAAITDIIDGHVARRFNVTSKFGRIVDPLADKVLVCGAFICFAWIGEPKLFGLSFNTLRVIHWSVVGILILREAYVTIIRQWAESKGLNFAATRSGKLYIAERKSTVLRVLTDYSAESTATYQDLDLAPHSRSRPVQPVALFVDANGTLHVADRAKKLGVRSVPAVVIDGNLADCCAGRGPDEATLKAAGLGQPLT